MRFNETVWPTKDGPYVISCDSVWMPGSFDSRDTAEKGLKMCRTNEGLSKLQEISKQVNHIDNENRLISMDDLTT